MHRPERVTTPSDTTAPASARTALVRVPAITVWFWLVKILTTGAGESTSDYLGRNYPHAIVVVLVAFLAKTRIDVQVEPAT